MGRPRRRGGRVTTQLRRGQPEIILTAEVNPDNLDHSFQLIALASSRLGNSKLLVFSTAACFRRPMVQQAEVQKLLANCLSWGSSAQRKRVQVWGGDDALATFLTQQARVRLVGTAATLDPAADVLLLSQEVANTAMVRRVKSFVRQGGTLLYGYPLPNTPLTPLQKLFATRFNHLLSQAGLLQSKFQGIDFEGLSEVTVNLYTIYVFDKLLHKGLYEHNHERLRSKHQLRK